MRFSTRAIHAGQDPEPVTGSVTVPVYLTSTYQQPGPGKEGKYVYSRTANPTRTALEECLASLEEGRHGLAFSSGMAATTMILLSLQKGDHVIAGDDIYSIKYSGNTVYNSRMSTRKTRATSRTRFGKTRD